MGRLYRFFAFIGFLAIGLVCVTGAGHCQDCGKTKDWKDIYVLPTNPNPQNNIKLTLSAEKQSLKPGDELKLTFSADRECYLTLIDMGTSGKILRLWPNDYSGQDNRIDPNTPRSFPSSADKFRYRVAGPDGAERLIGYATSEKGKILSEQEFQKLKDTGFKEYPGSAKDLAIQFQRRTEILGSGISWGTVQTNVCISSGLGSPPPVATTPNSKVYLLAIAGHGNFDNRPEDNSTDRLVEILGYKANIEKSNIRMLKEPESDYKGVSSGFRWLASSTQPEDTVIVYFTGHGGNDRGEGFLVLYPGQQKGMSKQEHLRRKILLTKTEFGSFIKKIPARKKILIVDSCHARAITKGVRADEGEFIPNYLSWPESEEEPPTMADKSGPPNYGNDQEALLAACRKEEVSYSHPRLKGAVFSYFLIEAIKQGCANLEDAFSRAKEKAAEHYRKSPKIKIPPNPCLVDPHGLVKDFRFRN
ncbi:MAG: DUF4384 domain-containing protein [Pseudomonadota bacterium]